jgi:hypothetical protein
LLAVRTLATPPGSPVVRLEIDQPSKNADDWACRLRIFEGDRLVAEDQGTGEDSLGALVNAIAGLRWHFDRSGLTAAWFHDEPGTGLPIYLPQGMGKEFDQRVRQLVENAVTERSRELEEKNSRPPD